MQKTWQVLLGNRGYIGLSCGLFAIGLLFGAMFTEQFEELIQAAMENLKDLMEQVQEKNDPKYTSLLIFWNNFKAAILMLAVGTLFSVWTMLMLLINGVVVGAVVAMTSGQMTVSVLDMVVFGLVPHGIFELPAIFIASAFGIKLGRVLIWPLKDKTRWRSYLFVWREVARIFWVLVLLLVVAAAIEGMITPQLIETFTDL